MTPTVVTEESRITMAAAFWECARSVFLPLEALLGQGQWTVGPTAEEFWAPAQAALAGDH